MNSICRLFILEFVITSLFIFLPNEYMGLNSKIDSDDNLKNDDSKLLPLKEWFKQVSNPLFKCSQPIQRNCQGNH